MFGHIRRLFSTTMNRQSTSNMVKSGKKVPPPRPDANQFPQLQLRNDRPSREFVHELRSIGRCLAESRPTTTIVVPQGVYQNYRGKFYLVTECSIEVESQELMVHYQALYQDDRNPDYTHFSQKLSRFLDHVKNDDGMEVPRFQLVDRGL